MWGRRWGGCETTMIIAAFVEGIKNPTGCYTGLAFMKKDIDVNDCEFPPLLQKKKMKKKKKLRHPLNFQNGRYVLPVFMQDNLLQFIFFNERRKMREKKG